MFWQIFLSALLGAVAALSGNAVMFILQGRAKIKEERRAFVRQLHWETVDVVADMDLLMRELRSFVVAGCQGKEREEKVKVITDEKWEGDLLRRVRRLRFGHPDPDVRATAEQLEDDFWPYMTTALRPAEETFPFPSITHEERGKVSDQMDAAMIEFRKAVYAAPIRKLPKRVEYDGHNRPSYLARAMAAKGELATHTDHTSDDR